MTPLTSLQNPRVKDAVRLRERGARDAAGRMLIEGYRETRRALDNHIRPTCFFYCPELFQGGNEPELLRRAADAGAELLECSAPVFRKLSYRDRPDGLLALAPQWRRGLNDLSLPENPLLLVMERIEKPGNLGTMLRTADAGGVDAVIVCDKCTDLFNPNVIRASIGTIFCVPTVEAATPETLDWLRARGIQTIAATPSATRAHTDVDWTRASAIVVGAEQYGLSDRWMKETDAQVRIPMRGQCDSLNVAAAATILVYEAVRQRLAGKA